MAEAISSGRSRVAVMQAAEIRLGHDLALVRRLHGSGVGRVPLQRQMRSGLVVVCAVLRQNPMQAIFAQHYHVVQALAVIRRAKTGAEVTSVPDLRYLERSGRVRRRLPAPAARAPDATQRRGWADADA